jgi:hypothetical protein
MAASPPVLPKDARGKPSTDQTQKSPHEAGNKKPAEAGLVFPTM